MHGPKIAGAVAYQGVYASSNITVASTALMMPPVRITWERSMERGCCMASV